MVVSMNMETFLAIVPSCMRGNEVKEAIGLPLGASELALWSRTYGKKVQKCMTNDERTYAYVLLDDGTFQHGAFNLHDTEVSLS